MKMLEKYGVTATELRVVGGGSKNRLWRRIIADAFQLPLRFPAEPESAALGGALQAAAVCAGVPVAEYVADNEPPCEPEVCPPAALSIVIRQITHPSLPSPCHLRVPMPRNL
jgi:xylulokinase